MLKSKLGYQALLAILLGIATGLFFGPYCSILKPIGDIFIFVLQVIVIFYIPSLLMHGLGSLTPELAKKLFRSGWPILLLLWVIVLSIFYVVKIVIPTALPNPATDFTLQIGPLPAKASARRLFDSIPTIALISLLFGLALMHLKNKEPLLGLLEKMNGAFDRMIKWISIVSPIGIFAHIAHVSGTVHFEDLAKLQLYLAMMIGVCLFLSLWVLPVLVSTLSSIPLKEIFQEFRIVSFLPFATAISTLALPFINNSMRRLAEKKHLELGTFRNTSQTMLPIGFGFAQIGNFVPMLFIFFLAFFYRHPLSNIDAFTLPFLITFFSVGTPQFTFVALPFLLKYLHFPQEGFDLYAEISAITLNFQVLLSTASMLSFMYLVMLKYYGLLQIQWRRLGAHTLFAATVLFLFAFIGKHSIHTEDNYKNLFHNLSMKEAIPDPPDVTVFQERTPPPPIGRNSHTLARILDRGVLRVGYDVRNIPFCYLNTKGEVVGYDIAYAYQLAKDLDVKLELVPFDDLSLISDLNAGFYDIAMSAVLMDEERIRTLQFSSAYTEQFNVLVIPRSRLSLFRNAAEAISNPGIIIGGLGGYQRVAHMHFPQSTVVPIKTMEEFVHSKLDALMWSELPAYIWCLTHPDYVTVSFDHTLGKKFFGYPCAIKTELFVNFIDDWLDLKEEQGFKLKQQQYWFLGKSQPTENQRWSIIRNVLHWTN